MKEYLLLNHMYRKAILTCQDGYGDDIKACRIAWEQYEELRTALLRKNELSTREYDI